MELKCRSCLGVLGSGDKAIMVAPDPTDYDQQYVHLSCYPTWYTVQTLAGKNYASIESVMKDPQNHFQRGGTELLREDLERIKNRERPRHEKIS